MYNQDTAPVVNEAKLTTWVNEPQLQSLKCDLDASKPAHDAQVLKIKKWVDLLKVQGTAKIEKVKGRSSVQPKLIRRQAEWRYSALSEPFLSSKEMFKAAPVTFEDGESAKQNQLVLNWQFRTKVNRIKFIDDFVRSNVDEGTCIVRTGWKRSVKTTQVDAPVYSYYAITSQQEMDLLKQAIELKDANPHEYSSIDPLVQAAVDYYLESGQPTVAQQTGTQKVDKELIIENRPTAELVNPENFYLDPSCGGDTDKALFAVVSFETNQAELLKETGRYKNLDKVDWANNGPLTQTDHATSTPIEYNFKDPMRKKVVAYEYWGYWDINSDGVLVPIVATWIGNTLIRMEESPMPDEKLPFVITNYLPVKREVYGEPDAEMLEDNQKILGAVTRGMIDLLGRSANGQQGMAKGMLDPLNKRRFDNGQDYEYNPNQNPNNGLIDHKYPDIPQSGMLMLNLQNQEAEALTGVKSFSGGMSGESYGQVAAGIRGVLDAASKREMAILRRLAKGITEIGNKFIAMNAVFLSEEEVIRVTNTEFITVKREDLKGNFDLEVDISTAEVDDAKAKDLGFMLQTIGPNIDPQITMKILSEIAELKRMPELAHDLKSWKPTPDPIQEQLKQLEVQKAQKEIELLDSEIQYNMARARREDANADSMDLNTMQESDGTKHRQNISQQQAQAKANQELEITKALTKPVKQQESAPNIDAAIGYNQLSSVLSNNE